MSSQEELNSPPQRFILSCKAVITDLLRGSDREEDFCEDGANCAPGGSRDSKIFARSPLNSLCAVPLGLFRIRGVFYRWGFFKEALSNV